METMGEARYRGVRAKIEESASGCRWALLGKVLRTELPPETHAGATVVGEKDSDLVHRDQVASRRPDHIHLRRLIAHVQEAPT